VELLNDGISIPWDAWSVPNSLREVEREINFVLDASDPSGEATPEYTLDLSRTRVAGSALEDDAEATATASLAQPTA